MTDIRINDDANRAREARFDPAEFDRAPAGTPLDGATDLQGVPIGYSKALEADAGTVLVTYNGVPMRLSQALELGLCTRAQLGQAQPADQPALQPQGQEAGQEGNSGDTAETLRAPMFDSADHENLNILTDAAQRSGFAIEAVARDLLADGLAPDSAAMVALAEASGQPVEAIAEVVHELNDHILGQLTEMAGEDLVRDAINAPGWNQAVLAGISSNSLLPMATFMAQLFESQQATGK